jgi:hypothetical protein
VGIVTVTCRCSAVRGGTGGAANCLRMAPPLTISDDEIDLAAEILDSALLEVTEHATPAEFEHGSRRSGSPA